MLTRAPRYGVLGPVELRDDGESVAIGSPSQRALLGVLLARAGQHIPADLLIDVLWGAAPPRTAQATLRSYVSRLRRHLGPALVGSADGYTLCPAPGELDADRFRATLTAARSLPPADAVSELRSALDLWRGPAFGSLADLEPVRGPARSLDQARIDARAAFCRALLGAGYPDDAIGAAEALTADVPLHEPGWAVLVDAFGTAGRPADGLAAYRQARAALTDEGLEPSAVLRQAQARLLSAQTAAPTPTAAPTAGAPLTGALIGRDADLQAVADLLTRSRLVTLVGPGGVGKTSLAVEVARAVANRHPRGRRLVELAALTDPSTLTEALVAGLGLSAEAAAAQDVLRRIGRLDLLIVLDNCEHLIDEVAAAATTMLASGSRLRLLATSRERLGLPGEQVWPVHPLPTEGAGSPAHQLFRARAEAVRPGAISGPDGAAAVDAVVRRLDGLPLAIEMAAARVATLSPADLATRIEERLDQQQDPLTGSRRRGDPRHRTLRSVIEWSVVLLTELERQALAQWTVFAGAVTAADAVAVLGVEAEVIESLAARSLLTLDPEPDETDGRTRYRMLRTVRAVLGPADPDVARRHAQHFAAVAAAADGQLRTPEELAGHRRLTGVLDELRVAHAWARNHDVRLAATLSRSLYLFGVSRLQDQVLGWAARLGPLLAGSTSDDRELLAGVNASIAYWLVVSGDLAAARRRAELAFGTGADQLTRIHALDSLCDIALFEGRLDEAQTRTAEMAALAEQIGDLHYGLAARGGTVLALTYAGRHDEAAQQLADLDARYRPQPLAPSERGWLAYFHGELLLEREPDAAAEALAEAIALSDSVGNRYLAGVARVSATSLQARVGEPGPALRLYADVLRHWLALASWSHLLTTLRNLVDVLDRVHADDAAAELRGAVSRADLTPSYGTERHRLELAGAHLLDRMGQARFAARTNAGAARDLESAAQAALRALESLGHRSG
jgi:predicted ATPase/DNA-binding SARP family transcriptional activator